MASEQDESRTKHSQTKHSGKVKRPAMGLTLRVVLMGGAGLFLGGGLALGVMRVLDRPGPGGASGTGTMAVRESQIPESQILGTKASESKIPDKATEEQSAAAASEGARLPRAIAESVQQDSSIESAQVIAENAAKIAAQSKTAAATATERAAGTADVVEDATEAIVGSATGVDDDAAGAVRTTTEIVTGATAGTAVVKDAVVTGGTVAAATAETLPKAAAAAASGTGAAAPETALRPAPQVDAAGLDPAPAPGAAPSVKDLAESTAATPSAAPSAPAVSTFDAIDAHTPPMEAGRPADHLAAQPAPPAAPAAPQLTAALEAAPSPESSDESRDVAGPVAETKTERSAKASARSASASTAAAGSAVRSNETPAWRRYAAKPPKVSRGQPILAIIIDDITGFGSKIDALSALDPMITFSIIPISDRAENFVRAARKGGREILLHLPMEPRGTADPGPNAITTTLSHAELERRLNWYLDRIDQYVGVNNHMGSKATESARVMQPVLEEIKRRGLLFIDSRTSSNSIAGAMSRKMGIPTADNQLFIDNKRDKAKILDMLDRGLGRAKRWGAAIVIGHPHSQTIAALKEWIPEHKGGEVALVPVSRVVARTQSWGH